MKSFKVQQACFACILILGVFLFISSSLVYGASDEQVSGHTTPDAIGAVALFAGSGGAGMTSRGIYTPVNGDTDAAAASASAAGSRDEGAVYPEPTSPAAIVNGRIHRAHPACQDSCSL